MVSGISHEMWNIFGGGISDNNFKGAKYWLHLRLYYPFIRQIDQWISCKVPKPVELLIGSSGIYFLELTFITLNAY
jgi:hypothetical protein